MQTVQVKYSSLISDLSFNSLFQYDVKVHVDPTFVQRFMNDDHVHFLFEYFTQINEYWRTNFGIIFRFSFPKIVEISQHCVLNRKTQNELASKWMGLYSVEERHHIRLFISGKKNEKGVLGKASLAGICNEQNFILIANQWDPQLGVFNYAMGHTMGLRHSDDEKNLMHNTTLPFSNFSINPEQESYIRRVLHDCDRSKFSVVESSISVKPNWTLASASCPTDTHYWSENGCFGSRFHFISERSQSKIGCLKLTRNADECDICDASHKQNCENSTHFKHDGIWKGISRCNDA